MAAPLRSLRQLCRAAWNLHNVSDASAVVLGAGRSAAGSLYLGSGGSVQQAAAAAGSLRQLARHFHASSGLPAAAEAPTPSVNPLQQAPTPAPGAGGSPLGPAPGDWIGGMGGEPSTLARAVSRGLAISPQKLNDFAKVVRGLHIQDALIQCKVSPKKSAKLVEKALLSAQANAVTNQGLDASRLRVAEAWVGKGSHLKRTSLHGRGRSGRRLRYRCHLTVLLREEEQEPRRRTRIMPMLAERSKWRKRGTEAARDAPVDQA